MLSDRWERRRFAPSWQWNEASPRTAVAVHGLAGTGLMVLNNVSQIAQARAGARDSSGVCRPDTYDCTRRAPMSTCLLTGQPARIAFVFLPARPSTGPFLVDGHIIFSLPVHAHLPSSIGQSRRGESGAERTPPRQRVCSQRQGLRRQVRVCAPSVVSSQVLPHDGRVVRDRLRRLELRRAHHRRVGRGQLPAVAQPTRLLLRRPAADGGVTGAC